MGIDQLRAAREIATSLRELIKLASVNELAMLEYLLDSARVEAEAKARANDNG